jgi:mannosyl-oligosaccharide glucosidase
LQISGSIPFKADIAFVSGTEVKNSKVEERVSRLTGFVHINSISIKKMPFTPNH